MHAPATAADTPTALRMRDVRVLAWLGEQYGARTDQLGTLLGCGERTVQRTLARLRGHGLITTHRLFVGEAPWVTPTSRGLTLCGSPFRVWRPRAGLLSHVAAVNDVRLHVQSRAPDSTWIPERELAAGASPTSHRPDGVLSLDGRRIAIEVELTSKSERRLVAILGELAGSFDQVVYFCAPGPHRRLAAIERTGRWPALAVRELCDLGSPTHTRAPARAAGRFEMSGTSGSRRAIFARRRRQHHPLESRPRVAPLSVDLDGDLGLVLGRRLSGERALPVSDGLALLTQKRLSHHVLVCGATGSGKTETLLRLAWLLARCTESQVFYLDGKGDRRNAERFVGLMARAGRQPKVFPMQPFDGWRGAAHDVHGRLMEIVDYSSEGPASWYRDVAKAVLRLVCDHTDGPPKSSRDVLARLDHSTLVNAHPGGAVGALTGEQVRQARLRYEAFFGQTRGALDGRWSWDDTECGYLLLDSLSLREEAAGLARFLLEDFSHYFTARKPRDRFCMLIVDEFSSLASGSGMAGRVEQARGFNTSLVLAPQVVAGMGDSEQAERIKGSVETVICHRVNTPEEIIALAGTRERPEYSVRYGSEGSTGEGSARSQHQFKVDPNKVRSLDPGVAFLISHGRAMKARILRAPHASAPLPTPVEPAGGEPAPGGPPVSTSSCGDGVPGGGVRSEGEESLPF